MKVRDGLRFATWLLAYVASLHAYRMGAGTSASEANHVAKADACNALDEFDRTLPTIAEDD